MCDFLGGQLVIWVLPFCVAAVGVGRALCLRKSYKTEQSLALGRLYTNVSYFLALSVMFALGVWSLAATLNTDPDSELCSCPVGWQGDGVCDAICDNEACGWDWGDCDVSTTGHQTCGSDFCPSSWLGDGMCDDVCNNADCSYDGGDCTSPSNPCPASWRGDGACDTPCDTAEYNYDDGDCSSTQDDDGSGEGEKLCSPGCTPELLANSKCDIACNTPRCGFDNNGCNSVSDSATPATGDGTSSPAVGDGTSSNPSSVDAPSPDDGPVADEATSAPSSSAEAPSSPSGTNEDSPRNAGTTTAYASPKRVISRAAKAAFLRARTFNDSTGVDDVGSSYGDLGDDDDDDDVDMWVTITVHILTFLWLGTVFLDLIRTALHSVMAAHALWAANRDARLPRATAARGSASDDADDAAASPPPCRGDPECPPPPPGSGGKCDGSPPPSAPPQVYLAAPITQYYPLSGSAYEPYTAHMLAAPPSPPPGVVASESESTDKNVGFYYPHLASMERHPPAPTAPPAE